MLYFLYILIAIVVLLVMIVIHELGHYVAGKILKFKINEFSVGFGPQLLAKTNKKTGEKFTLRLIPLGGYCAFEDESGLNAEAEINDERAKNALKDEVFPQLKSETAEEKPLGGERVRSFTEEKPWKRLIVLAAGATFNFISAIIFAFIFILAVGYTVPEVVTIYTDDAGVAYAQELREGDVITAVNGEKISVMKTYDDLVDKVNGKEYVLTVDRDGKKLDVKVKMQRIVNTSEELDYVGMGFTPVNTSVKCGFGTAIKYCVPYTFKLAFMVLASFGGLFTGRVPVSSMSGPVGTVGVMAELSMLDWRNLLLLLPLIAANLAVFNILPIPALDGCKMIFTTIEWVRGKPINRNVENIIHTVGMLLLFGFVIVLDLWGIFR